MKTRTSTTRKPLVLLLSLLALMGLVATACGAGTVEIGADRASSSLQPAPEPNGGAGGHQYGSTIDEWTETEQALQSDSGQGLERATSAEADEPANETAAVSPTIAWDDLIAPGFSGEAIVDRYRERLDAVEVGSSDATALYDAMQAEFDTNAVNPELDGQQIRLAGFVAPLTYEDEIVTEFLLVPNFGACIHVPPPPPNQTIMVTVDRENGLTTDEAWGAVWVEGTLVIESSTSDLAPASYRIDSGTSGVYSDF